MIRSEIIPMVLPEKSPAARSMFIDAQPCLKDLRKGASHQTHIPSRCPVSTRCCPPFCLLVYNPMNTLAISPVISPEKTQRLGELRPLESSGIIWVFLKRQTIPFYAHHLQTLRLFFFLSGFHSTTQNSMKKNTFNISRCFVSRVNPVEIPCLNHFLVQTL